MTPRDRFAWIASWVAPLAAWVALLGLVIALVRPDLARFLGRPDWHAWLLSFLVLLWFASHLTVRFHSRRVFSRDQHSELHFRLDRGRGYSHWRRLMRQHGKTWWGGKSHSGERPRFD
jgi:hypothetical protein